MLELNRGPHGELRFTGKVQAISPVTHTISVLHKAETRPFAFDDQTKLVKTKGQPFDMKELKKGDVVTVLYVASKGVWKAHEIRK